MTEPYQQAVLARIRKGTAAHPGSCGSQALLGKAMQKRFDRNALELEAELTKMVKAGLIVCTSGAWWVR